MPFMPLSVKVAARDSPLSRAQVEEVQEEFLGEISFIPIYVKTTGDLDKTTSLRDLEKTDFFTRQIDELLLRGECRAAIHSAKDLPDPLPKGLVIAKLTRGKDPADVLVLREGETLERVPKGAKIATSSIRREENVRQILKEVTFVDIRGTIQERYAKLKSGEVEGVVMAEAAILRLKMNWNRFPLPGEVHPLQGKLAIVVREEDENSLFRA